MKIKIDKNNSVVFREYIFIRICQVTNAGFDPRAPDYISTYFNHADQCFVCIN